MKALKNMSDEEFAEYRDKLATDKRAISDKQVEAELEFQVREATRGLPANVKKIILEGKVEATGESAAS